MLAENSVSACRVLFYPFQLNEIFIQIVTDISIRVGSSNHLMKVSVARPINSIVKQVVCSRSFKKRGMYAQIRDFEEIVAAFYVYMNICLEQF